MNNRFKSDLVAAIFFLGCIAFLLALFTGYYMLYPPPQLNQLTSSIIDVRSMNTQNFSLRSNLGSTANVSFIEIYGTSDGGKSTQRFIISKWDSEQIMKAINRSKGRIKVWFDLKQANEIFQLESSSGLEMIFEDVYKSKLEAWSTSVSWLSKAFFACLSLLGIAIFFEKKNGKIKSAPSIK